MADEPKPITIWDGILDEPASDARTKAIKEAVEAGLKAFEQQKEGGCPGEC